MAKVFETLDPYASLVIAGSQVMKTHHEIVCSRVMPFRAVEVHSTKIVQ